MFLISFLAILLLPFLFSDFCVGDVFFREHKSPDGQNPSVNPGGLSSIDREVLNSSITQMLQTGGDSEYEFSFLILAFRLCLVFLGRP